DGIRDRNVTGVQTCALPISWRSTPILAAMSRAAGLALRADRVRLTGLAPNGQRFVANPLHIWVARESSARLQGADLGAMGPAPEIGRASCRGRVWVTWGWV